MSRLELTEEQKTLAIELAEQGHTIKYIREELCLTQSAFSSYLKRHPDYNAMFTRARQDGLEELADSLQTIADEVEDVQRARLKSENLRWILSKRKPQVYGDKIEVSGNVTIDIGQALAEARARASLPTMPTNAIVEAESSIVSDTSDAQTTDCISVADLLE